MDTMTTECLGIWLLALAVIVVCGALALATSPTHPLTGPDATETTDDDDDIATANGEPMVIGNTIITVYAPSHLPALGYVIVPAQPSQPSQQHRQRLDGEAAHE